MPAGAPTFVLQSVRLRVASLARAEAFYAGVLGLGAQPGPDGTRRLGAGPAGAPLIVLEEVPGAPAAPAETAGLFHLALLVPSRADLARILVRLAERRWPVQGLSDHGVSEAIYLTDPDGNGLELYADRPPVAWPRDEGRLAMSTARLDVAGLLAAVPDRGEAGLPAGTRIGHLHLRVRDLGAAEAFFGGQLGLAVTTRDYPGALFLAADGYHHHIGANTWGVTRPPAGPGSAGLAGVAATVVGLPAPRTLLDPNGTPFALSPA